MRTLIIVLAAAALAPLPVAKPPGASSCPSGFYRTGNYCSPTSPRSRPAILRTGNSCPSGWTRSGAFCQSN